MINSGWCCGAAVIAEMVLPKRARGLMGLMAAAITLLVPSVSAIVTVSLSSGDIEKSAYNDFIARADKTVEWVTQNENYVMQPTYSVVVPVGYTLYFNPSTAFNELSRTNGSTPMFEVYGTLHLGALEIESSADEGAIAVVRAGGQVLGVGTTFHSSQAVSGNGGAFYVEGTVDLEACSVRENTALVGGGGAVFVAEGGTFTAKTTAFKHNSALYGGALASNASAATTVLSSTFEQCNATESGGDLWQSGGNLRLEDFTSAGAAAGVRGGFFAASGGHLKAHFRNGTVSGAYATDYGGGVAVAASSSVEVVDVVVSDANCGREMSALGGGFYLDGDGAHLLATRLTLANTLEGSLTLPLGQVSANCQKGIGSGCRRQVWRGGGIYASNSAFLEASDLICHSMHADGSGACLYATGDTTRVNLVGGTVNSTTNASRAVALVGLSGGHHGVVTANLTAVTFANNRRGALLVSNSKTNLVGCSFTGDTALNPNGRGGSLYVDQGSELNGVNLTANDNLADVDGGWLFAKDSTVHLEGFTAAGNEAISKGGVIYADSMFAVLMSEFTIVSNTAREGGALFARACAKVDKHVPNNLYYGVQLKEGLLADNVARIGGALTGVESFLVARDVNFYNNTFKGLNPAGSASTWTPDAVYEQCNVAAGYELGSLRENYDNMTVIEGERVVLDSVSFNLGSDVIALRLRNSTSSVGNGYTVLSRNTNLANLRIVGNLEEGSRTEKGVTLGGAASQVNNVDNSWHWQSCDNNAAGEAQGAYKLSATSIGTRMLPNLDQLPLVYDPVCPRDATCVDVPSQFTISCTCPTGSAFATINNDLAQCQTFAPTPTPTSPPSAAEVTTVAPTNGPKVKYVNLTMATVNPYLGVDAYDLYQFENLGSLTETVWATFYAFAIFVAVAVLATLVVDCSRFQGMTDDEFTDWVLGAMYLSPGNFQLMLGVDREDAIEQLEANDARAHARADAMDVSMGGRTTKSRGGGGGGGGARRSRASGGRTTSYDNFRMSRATMETDDLPGIEPVDNFVMVLSSRSRSRNKSTAAAAAAAAADEGSSNTFGAFATSSSGAGKVLGGAPRQAAVSMEVGDLDKLATL